MNFSTYSKLHVLLVDDNQLDLGAMVKVVSKNKKIKITTAKSYQETISHLSKNRFDVAFIDYFLGDGVGLDLLKQNFEVPIVILTGLGTEHIVVDTLTQGAYDYIPKDIENNYLHKIVTIVNEVSQIKKNGHALSMSLKDIDNFLLKLTEDLTQENIKNFEISTHKNDLIKKLAECELTLKNVLLLLDKQKSEAQQEMAEALKQEIIPYVHQLKNGVKNKKEILGKLKATILKYTENSENKIKASEVTKLTPTEKKICKYLKMGMTIKELAGKLDIAVSTAYDHTKAIRKKLKISGSKVNLTSYLSRLDFD